MGINKLIILHRDGIYAKAFSEALTAYWKFASVIIALSPEGVELDGADYVLTDNRVLAMKLKERGIYLYDDESDVQDDVFSIARFQSMRSIVCQLIEHCAGGKHLNHASLKEVGDTSFIGITSGAGGSGTSSLAICMGRVLSRLYGKAVLYISFEAYKPLSYAFDFRPTGHSADILLYHLLSKSEDSALSLDDYFSEDSYSLKCISGMSKSNPFVHIEEDGVYQLLHCIACCGQFEIVILDVPCSFPHYKFLMRMCENQIVNFGFKKHCHIPSELSKEELGTICEYDIRAVKKRLFEFKPLEDRDSFILKGGRFDIDIHGQFGAEVRALVDSMEI